MRLHPPSVRCRGVTLVEAGLGAALVAMVAGGLLLLVGPETAQAEQQTALRDAQTVGDAVRAWRRRHTAGCPTLTELKRTEHLGPDARTEDPWGGRYRVVCRTRSITVRSPGPDRRLETDDDIRWRAD